MAAPVVIDLSHHNPTPNWATLVTNGVVGIIHKATEGYSYKDPTLYDRARAAMDAGLLWSTYHFMRPGSSMGDQMDWYLEVVDPVEGERLCLDHEDPGVSLADLEDAVGYLKGLRPDIQIAIYSGHVIKEQLGSDKSVVLADNTSLWIAQYTSAASPSWPKGTWPQWSLWQYTDKAKVNGISQPVDGNKFNGTIEQLKAWFGPAEAEPIPPEPTPPPVAVETLDVALTSSPGVRVSISLNGEVVLAAAATS